MTKHAFARKMYFCSREERIFSRYMQTDDYGVIMKKIGFKNFKRFADCPILDLSGITFLVGKNNAGKSSFTHAARLAANFINQTSTGGNLESVFSFEVGKQPASNRYRGYNSVLHRGSKDGKIEFRVDYGEFVLDFGIGKKYNPFGFIEDEIYYNYYEDYYSAYPDAETIPELNTEWLNSEVERRMRELQHNNPEQYKELLDKDKDGKGEICYIHYYDKTNKISGLLENGETTLVFYDFPNEVGEEHTRLCRLIDTLPEEDRPTVQARLDELNDIIEEGRQPITRRGVLGKGFKKRFRNQNDITLPELYSIDCLAGDCLAGTTDLPDDEMSFEQITAFLNEGDHRVRLESFKKHFSIHLYRQMPSCARHIGHFTDDETTCSRLIRDFRNHHVHGRDDLMSCVAKWVKELEIGDGITIHEDPEDGLMGCYVLKTTLLNGKKHKYEEPFEFLGVGSRQLIILLMNLALVVTEAAHESYPTLLTVEEPEQNLHPAIQSKLADLFLDFYDQFGCQCIVETHSEYIIRRAQVLVAEGIRKKVFTLEDNPFKVYYFPDDDSSPYDMTFKENGRFERSFGPGFVDVAGESNLALLDIATLFDWKK